MGTVIGYLAPSFLHGVRFEIFEIYELKHRGMRCFKIDGRGAAVVERGFPSRNADAPTISRFEAGKTPLRHGRHEIVPIEDGEIEEFLSDFHANRVQPDIVRPGPAIAIAIKSRYRVAATAAQLSAKNVRDHGAQ